jgi:two-component sensor histidine kinase
MSWVEELGPAVVPPRHNGFGQKVIQSMIETAVDGTTDIGYPPGGFFWKLQAPAEGVLEPVTADDAEIKPE